LEAWPVDYEAILDVSFNHTIVGFGELVDGGEFDAVVGAVVEHLLGLGHAANHGAGE